MVINLTPQQTLPPCAQNNYDCKNCNKPQIPKWPKGPTAPCTGEIHFCKFATPHYYPNLTACKQVNLQNYPCTHGGSNCAGFQVMWNRLKYGDLPKKGVKHP